MQTVNRMGDLREAVDELRTAGEVALVPTMGALHEGHLTLVRKARELAPAVVVSIFVNPAQFGPNEDLDAYPRQLAQDQRALESEGVDLLWAPPVEEVYPPGFATTVSVSGLGERLCGAARPGHFAGVTTVVAKLFAQVMPHWAVFGEKDWQQLAILRRMTGDLDLTRPAPSRIVGVPVVREADGLAMSSRNRYLSPDDRRRAAALPRSMREGIAHLAEGHAPARVTEALRETLLAAGFTSIDYVEIADVDTLAPVNQIGSGRARLFVAARIGTTRLIDNMPIGPASRP